MGFSFLSVIGLLSLLSIIPLIILYLIKPKPEVLKVPSLMFFLQKSKTTRIQSLFRNFQKELLFLIQLAVLILLSLSISQPVLTLNKDAVSNNIVFLLDASASSNVLENGQTRLDLEKDKIKELAVSRNSLIIIKSIPIIALNGVGKSELKRYIDGIQSTDDTTDLSSAILAAGELIANGKGRIVVLSDLHSSKGIPLEVARNIVEGKGIAVDLIDVGTKNSKNIGIVNLEITEENANLYVKNYGTKEENVKLKIGNQEKILSIKPGSIEPYVFKYGEGVTEIKLEVNDDFKEDNKIYLIKPFNETIKVLYISNSPSKFLKAAISSIKGFDITYAEPPVIPKDNFDLYIINNVDVSKVLHGTFKEINDKNKPVIITSQENIDKLDAAALLGANFGNSIDMKNQSTVSIKLTNSFTKDIDFGDVGKIYPINFKGQEIASAGNKTVIGLIENSENKIFYYGLLDSQSDFKLNPNYPVFWNSVTSYLLGRSSLNELNLRTGNTLEIGNQSILLDKSGIFDYGKKKFAVNLLDEKESDINAKDEAGKVSMITNSLEAVKTNVDYELSFYLILIALIFIIFEFYYIKRRGEL